jgi:1-acyl-sn-glycerol-3-phosphate acyltransferase
MLCRLFIYGFFRIEVIGKDNIPSTGPVILCSNHLSNLDPPLVGIPLSRQVNYMAKAELFKVPLLGMMIKHLGAFPVKRGGVSKESIRTALGLLKQGGMLCVFPEGTRSRGAGMGKKGAASLATRSGASVIPVGIVGRYRLFGRMTIVYGKPLDLTAYADGSSDSLEQATERIMTEIRGLLARHTE